MSESEIREERLKKLAKLKKEKIDPYPSNSERTATIAEFLSRFESLLSSSGEETLAGRVMSIRGQGGIIFADIYDGVGRIQIVLQKSEMAAGSFDLIAEAVDIGDFVEFSGVAYKTKRGEQSLKAASWRMLSKSLLPIPSEWFGVKDEETRLRQRYLDLLLNEELRALFVRRAKFWQAIRSFYLEHGFLEVETPVLETSPGGADARPFVTHHNALDIDVYLRISTGELWQKKLLIAGFPKVFEIGRVFRNEGQSREHLQDYTQVESYEAYQDFAGGMKFVQELFRYIVKNVYGRYSFTIGEHTVDFAEDWPILEFAVEIKKRYDVDLTSSEANDVIRLAMREGATDVPNKQRAVDYLWKKARRAISGPAFLTSVPVELEPLAKRSAKNPNVVERMQVIIAGSEIGKGYSELNDPQDQLARFAEQQKMRDAGDEEAQRMDKEFVRAMEYGMPPAFGFGLSERFFAFLENKPIHEVQLFPLLRPKPND